MTQTAKVCDAPIFSSSHRCELRLGHDGPHEGGALFDNRTIWNDDGSAGAESAGMDGERMAYRLRCLAYQAYWDGWYAGRSDLESARPYRTDEALCSGPLRRPRALDVAFWRWAHENSGHIAGQFGMSEGDWRFYFFDLGQQMQKAVRAAAQRLQRKRRAAIEALIGESARGEKR